VLLLLSDAGVWVGLAKFFPPTRRSGWVFFHPLSNLGAGSGRTFGIFREIYGGQTYDYRDRK
jgi:hypothetical protein